MKQLVLATALSTLFAVGLATSACAEDDRDQAGGKHDMGPGPNEDATDFHSATDGRVVAPVKKSRSAPNEQPKEQTR